MEGWILIYLLQRLGFLININKSDLKPIQKIEVSDMVKHSKEMISKLTQGNNFIIVLR